MSGQKLVKFRFTQGRPSLTPVQKDGSYMIPEKDADMFARENMGHREYTPAETTVMTLKSAGAVYMINKINGKFPPGAEDLIAAGKEFSYPPARIQENGVPKTSHHVKHKKPSK